jgi:hypothetical protein
MAFLYPVVELRYGSRVLVDLRKSLLLNAPFFWWNYKVIVCHSNSPNRKCKLKERIC